jgi:cell wall-associated NlpC family hydrolase
VTHPTVPEEWRTLDVVSPRFERFLGATAAVAAVVAAVSLTPASATAAPTSPPSTSTDPVTRYNQLSDQANALNEKIDTANIRLANEQKRARQASREVAAAKQAERAAQAQENTYQAQVDQFTDASYEGARLGTLPALLTGTSVQDYLDRARDLQDLASTNADALNKLSSAVHRARQAERRAQAGLTTAKRATAAAQALKNQLTRQARSLHKQISRLTAAKNALSARQQAQLTSTGVQGVFIAPPGVRGAAMNIALAQRGKPYQWGAAGPDSFDCSGLVLWAYAQAGMPGLPHSAQMQSTMGVAVSRADLEPGDLVFFDNPVGHVGIYVGNDLMVTAPHSGAVVRVERLFSGYAGARRLGA